MELVDRLRAEYARNGGQGAYAWRSRELCGKAADEIERLRAVLEKIGRMYDEWDPDGSFASTMLARASSAAVQALGTDKDPT